MRIPQIKIFIFLIYVFVFLFLIFGSAMATDADISCKNYHYPWCGENQQGFAPLVHKFYLIALGLAGAAALGVLIYGAILWTLSGAVTSKQDALEWIKGALWGLILLLGAYLILYTINPNLVQLTEPEIKAVNVKSSSENQPPSGLAGSSWPLGPAPTGTYSDEAARSLLAENNIKINKANCVYYGQTNCTSLDGLPQSTVNNLIDLEKAAQKATGHSIEVTGGTEAGHKTHGPGKPIVDIGYDQALLNTIDSWKDSGKITYYQCEQNRVKVPCSGGSLTPDHYHVVFSQ